jgi:hypothetical protein
VLENTFLYYLLLGYFFINIIILKYLKVCYCCTLLLYSVEMHEREEDWLADHVDRDRLDYQHYFSLLLEVFQVNNNIYILFIIITFYLFIYLQLFLYYLLCYYFLFLQVLFTYRILYILNYHNIYII